MATVNKRYLAYLLRIWLVNDAGKWVWRASLEDPHIGIRHGFASLDALIAFLWEQVRDLHPEGGTDRECGGQ